MLNHLKQILVTYSDFQNDNDSPVQYQVTNPEWTDGTEQGIGSVPSSTIRFKLQK